MLVLDFPVANAAPELGAVVVSVIAAEFNRSRRYDVVSAKDIRAILEKAAAGQELGCTNDSCLSDIAGAMGAKLVVHGDVSRLDDSYFVNISLFDAEHAVGLGRENVEASSADALPTQVSAAVRRLLGEQTTSPVLIAGVITAGCGALLGAGGVVGAAWATDVETTATSSGDAKNAALQVHPWFTAAAAVGAGALVVGGALIAVGLLADPP